jgi:hypothetical protein
MATDLGTTAALTGTVASDVQAGLYAQMISGAIGGNCDGTAAYLNVLNAIAKPLVMAAYPPAA